MPKLFSMIPSFFHSLHFLRWRRFFISTRLDEASSISYPHAQRWKVEYPIVITFAPFGILVLVDWCDSKKRQVAPSNFFSAGFRFFVLLLSQGLHYSSSSSLSSSIRTGFLRGADTSSEDTTGLGRKKSAIRLGFLGRYTSKCSFVIWKFPI